MQALYPNNSGPSGEAFQGMEEEFEGECVAAYNDYLIDEFYSISKRFIPLAILPYANMERTLTEVKRAVGRGHKGIVMISAPHLRGLPTSTTLIGIRCGRRSKTWTLWRTSTAPGAQARWWWI